MADEDQGGLHSLFPTHVWQLRVGADMRERISAGVDAVLEGRVPELASGQSWQSEPDLHEHDELEPLCDAVRRATLTVLRTLHVAHERFEITGCWANVNARHAHHPRHTHPNNYLSGVYYVQAPEGANCITFHDPRPQAAVLRPPVSELSAHNADHAAIEVTSGTILMFPAWLEHSVPPSRSDEPRVSLSFNVMLSAYAEELAAPQWTGGLR